MRIACIGYRNWALEIYDRLAGAFPQHTFLSVRSRAAFDEQAILDFKPKLALFYGWSWHVGPTLLAATDCIMLHPSPLPRYRGGSPIQNQIIAGETTSAVSLFVMTEELDAGDLVGQQPISLDGSLDDVLARVTEVGLSLTIDLLQNGLHPVPQNHSQATFCKRRTPADSEITLEELQHASGRYLYDKIRMLGDPYPNAFIRTGDGKRLLLKGAALEEE